MHKYKENIVNFLSYITVNQMHRLKMSQVQVTYILYQPVVNNFISMRLMSNSVRIVIVVPAMSVQ